METWQSPALGASSWSVSPTRYFHGVAAWSFGCDSAREFDLALCEQLRAGILDLGRASIDREHRTPEVLTLLWRGIAQYAIDMGLRYLIGCSSLNSKDPAEGWQMYRQLEAFRVTGEFETRPTARYACPAEHPGHCTQPQAKDCEFSAIESLTLLNLKLISSAARHRFPCPLTQ